MKKFMLAAWVLICSQMFLLLPCLNWGFSTAGAASLTISDGVTVKSGLEGQIIVRDSLNAGKARFTSGNALPAPGDWKGIRVEGSATDRYAVKWFLT